jgi:hypothetical protein
MTHAEVVEHEAFSLTGIVEAVLVGMTPGSHKSTMVKKISVVRDHGIKGDLHAGTRLMDSREDDLKDFGFRKGTEISNHRQFSAVSIEELTQICEGMNLPGATLPLGCLGENLVVSGIPRFTELPRGTMMFFRHGTKSDLRNAVLMIMKENAPCIAPGHEIQEMFPDFSNIASKFPKAAIGKRGVVGVVYSSGTIAVGDTVIVRIPAQRIYKIR